MDEIKPDLVDELLKRYEKTGRHHRRKWAAQAADEKQCWSEFSILTVGFSIAVEKR
jgi:hypothetical protein